MNRLLQNNISEIAGLSQRGATLSVVDLIEANTISLEMAAYSLEMISNGASFLTAARPGNAGKTTLLACLLTFIAHDAEIKTLAYPQMLESLKPNDPLNHCEYMLIHEIGSGPYYGYMWGPNVAKTFSLISNSRKLASCIHADTMDELSSILKSRVIGVSDSDFSKLDLIYFMHLQGDYFSGYTRRVAAVYEAFGDSDRHSLLFRWDPNNDTFVKSDDESLLERMAAISNTDVDGVRTRIEECADLLDNLCRMRMKDFRQVRTRIVSFLEERSRPRRRVP